MIDVGGQIVTGPMSPTLDVLDEFLRANAQYCPVLPAHKPTKDGHKTNGKSNNAVVHQ